MTVGYSETPLARKLGIKEGSSALLIEAPAGYKSLRGVRCRRGCRFPGRQTRPSTSSTCS